MTIEPAAQPARPLLELLASLPRELLVEGTRIDVLAADGREYSITLGETISPAPDDGAFLIPPRVGSPYPLGTGIERWHELPEGES